MNHNYSKTMNNKIIIKPIFFNRPIQDVCRNLIGKQLVSTLTGEKISLQINEIEAYDGPDDKACHGRFGKTSRTAPMFGPAGHFYVYLIYGMYWMLNIVTGPKDYPAAILIRGAGKICGPGRLTKRLNIDKQLNNKLACPKSSLWIEDTGITIPNNRIITTPRIGIDYAGPEWSQKPYRYTLKKSS